MMVVVAGTVLSRAVVDIISPTVAEISIAFIQRARHPSS